jgi:hypothetical protein
VPIVTFLFTWTLTTHGKYSVSGDEPHYLMVAESLLRDGDLDVANNYAHNDGRRFGHDGLPMELHAVRSRTGEVRSIHSIGLPIALLPVYALAQQVASVTSEPMLKRFRMDRGLFAYSLVSLFLIALTSCGLTLLATGLTTVTTPGRAAALTIAIGVSPPVVSHAFLVFPEVAALFVTCCVVWCTMKRPSARDARLAPLLLLFLGALPWMHHKYFLYGAGLTAFAAWGRRDLIRQLPRSTRVVSLAVWCAPQLALLAWSQYEWGTVAGAIATGALTASAAPFAWTDFWSGVIGLWFDRRSGLLAYAPLYWIAPACWWLTRRRTGLVAVPVTLLYLPAAAFVIGWWAGFAPAARYLAPAMPLLAVPIAQALGYRAVRGAAAILLVMQAAITAVIWQHPRWLWPADVGNLALQALGPPGAAYAALLPDVRADGVSMAALSACLVALVVTVVVVTVALNGSTSLRRAATRP